MDANINQSGERKQLNPNELFLEQDYQLILADLKEHPDPEAFLSACERTCLEVNPGFFDLLKREILEKNATKSAELIALIDLIEPYRKRSKVRVKAWEYFNYILQTSLEGEQIKKYSDRQSFDRVIFPFAYQELEKADEKKKNNGDYITIQYVENRISDLLQEIKDKERGLIKRDGSDDLIEGSMYWYIYVQNSLTNRLLGYYFLPRLVLDENKSLAEIAEEIYSEAEKLAKERFKKWKEELNPLGSKKAMLRQLDKYIKNVQHFKELVVLPEYSLNKDRKRKIEALMSLLYDAKEGYDVGHVSITSITSAYCSQILADKQLLFLDDSAKKLSGVTPTKNTQAKKVVLYYYYLSQAGHYPLYINNKEGAYQEIAEKKGFSIGTIKNAFIFIASPSNRTKGKGMKRHIESVIPDLKDYPDAQKLAEKDLKQFEKRS
ncbi:MAG TPA: hypothetical protein PKA00_11145 [Saprospiraceae bacterium]|nr:hypothetical protein [Saprospiraceae bacterium]HMQ83458.1 hypothetical protein [Saprospiraceae bacterium]